jgi:hypothetical protein
MNKTWMKVVNAELIHAAGNSLSKEWLPLGNVWELTLEDGRVIMYPVRYTKKAGGKRGWLRRRSYEDALPAPKKVKVAV